MTCAYCGKPVPFALRLPDAELPAYCSGRCLRLAFLSAVTDLCKAALTPSQFYELTAKPTALPALDSPGEIREAITVITDALLAERVQPRQASTLLYALQCAISTLRLECEQQQSAAYAAACQPQPDPPVRLVGFAADSHGAIADHPEPPESRRRKGTKPHAHARPKRRA